MFISAYHSLRTIGYFQPENEKLTDIQMVEILSTSFDCIQSGNLEFFAKSPLI